VRVYEKMTLLSPPPEGVTREGILRLDQDMLNRWRDTLNSNQARSIPEAIRYTLGRIRSGVQRKVRSVHSK